MSNYRLTARSVVIRNGKILLNSFNNGLYYNLPGGGVEAGETIRQAVEREVLEESGYKVESKDLLYVYEYNPIRDKYSYGDRGSLSHVFLCVIDERVAQRSPTVYDQDSRNPDNTATGPEWIEIDKLNDIKLVPPIGHIIQADYLDNDFSTKLLEDIH